MSNLRSKRKNEHLILALQGSRCSFSKGFAGISLGHNCLTQIDPRNVDLSVKLWGHLLKTPLYINAITGGTLMADYVNRLLVNSAKRLALPIALGSQSVAIEHPENVRSFRRVRKLYPGGLILANVSAGLSPKAAITAVDMLNAQVLQLHLNAAQEMIMTEGDPPNPRLLDNIAEICQLSPVPVMVKEVGFGIAGPQAKTLASLGVSAIDISGTGGTNFVLIEGLRSGNEWWQPFSDWGWPTALCIAEASKNVPELEILASGGVNDGVKLAIALALGAHGCGVAGAPLNKVFRGGQIALDSWLDGVLVQLRIAIALSGISQVKHLKRVPLIISGSMGELFRLRGIDLKLYAGRG